MIHCTHQGTRPAKIFNLKSHKEYSANQVIIIPLTICWTFEFSTENNVIIMSYVLLNAH